MNAIEIIREIESLPPQEQAKVADFVRRLNATQGKLSPEELVDLAERMVDAGESEEGDALEAQLLAGFYGK